MKTESKVASRIKSVAIAGAGGIGSYLAGFLYDFGVNRAQFPAANWSWVVFDDDTVDATNLLHQNFTEDDIGRPKAEIISERTARLLRPELRFMTKDDFDKYDVVFSCVDSMTFRKDLYHYGFRRPDFYWVDGRCSSRNIGMFNSKVSEKILLANLTDTTERRGCLREVDKKEKTSHITPVIVAATMAQCFLNHLREEDTTSQILLYL